MLVIAAFVLLALILAALVLTFVAYPQLDAGRRSARHRVSPGGATGSAALSADRSVGPLWLDCPHG